MILHKKNLVNHTKITLLTLIFYLAAPLLMVFIQKTV